MLPKREMFVGIQHNRMIFAKGYDVQPWRTGGESVLPGRTTAMFATQVQFAGVVKALNNRCITIEFDDPEQDDQVIELGIKIGKGAGKFYPHELITDYKVGQRVFPLDVVVFHRYYFKRDWWNPGQVLWRSGSLALIGILDIPETHEDSSFSFENLAKASETVSAKPVCIVKDSRLNIRGLVKVGDVVNPRDILATFEEQLATDLSGENQDAVDALNKMSQYNPRAGVHGTVVSVEVFYRAQIEDMSDSMAEMVVAADKKRAKRVKELKLKESTSGFLRNPNARINGEPVGEYDVAILIYVSYDHPAGMGDKGTFSSQAKSVTSSVGHGVNETEDGRPLSAIFSGTSISNRIIGSPEVVGTTNLVLLYGSEETANIYFNEDK